MPNVGVKGMPSLTLKMDCTCHPLAMPPANPVSDSDAQVEVDDNGEPLTDTPDKPQQKKVEDDAVVKKALELLAKG